jgi:hypothetical protein
VTREKNIEMPSTSAMPRKVFIGTNIKEKRNRERKSYIKIGSMLIMLEESKDGTDIIHGFPRLWSSFHSSYMRPELHPIMESQDMKNLKSIRTQVSSARQAQSKIVISPTYGVGLE